MNRGVVYNRLLILLTLIMLAVLGFGAAIVMTDLIGYPIF